MPSRRLLRDCICLVAAAFLARPAHAAPAPDDDDDNDKAARPVTELVVTARRLDAARASVEASLGASTYSVSNDVVENRPGGEAANLVHVLLQMPGVSQGGSGELAVRSQPNLQYRINGVLVPDGVADLAETLRARFADNVELVTGALPAQYGLQVGGVVNVTTKNGIYQNGGEAEVYGGSHGRLETAFEAAGGRGGTNAYVSGSYLHDRAGSPGVDGGPRPAHDATDQLDAFAFVDHILDERSRVSLIAGASDDRSELPTGAGAQRSRTAYGIVSYQRSAGALTYQVAGSARASELSVGGEGVDAERQGGDSLGLQAEGVYEAGPAHRLRAGLVASAAGRGRSEQSLFAQDEWRPLTGLTVNYGLRLDAAAGDSALEPRLNAVFEPTAGTVAHAGYARYFIRPDDTDAPSPGHAPRAETDDYFDIGLQQRFEDLRVGVDAYWRDARDLLDDVRVGATALRRPFNFAQGRVRGVELSATYADGPASAWGSLALARAEGRRIVSAEGLFTPAELAAAEAFTPTTSDQRVTASLGASYRWGAMRLSADGLFGSGLPRTAPGRPANRARERAYAQANLSAVYRLDGLGGRPFDLRLDVINLFDSAYALSDGTSLAHGAPRWGPRRGVFVGLEQQF